MVLRYHWRWHHRITCNLSRRPQTKTSRNQKIWLILYLESLSIQNVHDSDSTYATNSLLLKFAVCVFESRKVEKRFQSHSISTKSRKNKIVYSKLVEQGTARMPQPYFLYSMLLVLFSTVHFGCADLITSLWMGKRNRINSSVFRIT